MMTFSLKHLSVSLLGVIWSYCARNTSFIISSSYKLDTFPVYLNSLGTNLYMLKLNFFCRHVVSRLLPPPSLSVDHYFVCAGGVVMATFFSKDLY